MIKDKNLLFKNKSLLDNFWEIKPYEERLALYSSQKNDISLFLAKLLLIRGIDSESVFDFLNPDIQKQIPNPYLLKDMGSAVKRTITAIVENQKIGIIADYDVDGSTSASILFKFLKLFNDNIYLRTPNRLSEGYGPNLNIMEEMLEKKIDLIFTLDCGTTSFDIIDNNKFSNIDVIIIDHHLSELTLPKVHSIINPNRYDESNEFTQMAAVGVTFLFLMALRKTLRDKDFFKLNIKEPNLVSFLDFVALGTVCDVVSLIGYNRVFVKIGLDLIKQRKNLPISKIIENSNINSTPSSTDLGFIIGPQLNAASRVDDSSLPVKFLISNNLSEIDSISRKLSLFNEKRKLIENNVFQEAIIQAENQINNNYILVYGENWHHGVLGIVASRLIARFNKPSIVLSFINQIGVGSARSIRTIDLGKIILDAKNDNILISGGGHKMAAGLKIHSTYLNNFKNHLDKSFKFFSNEIFQKIEIYDSKLSINEINNDLLETLEKLEPFGSGNHEPKFIINNFLIKSVKVLKDKHLLIFTQNDFSSNLKAICFNCIGTALGDYLINYKNKKLIIGCTIKRNNFDNISSPQIIIKDAMIIN